MAPGAAVAEKGRKRDGLSISNRFCERERRKVGRIDR